MIHGEKLTEYSSQELDVLLLAIGCGMDHYKEICDDDAPDEVIKERQEILNQWRVKVIEAKAEVRVREIQTSEN